MFGTCSIANFLPTKATSLLVRFDCEVVQFNKEPD